MVEKIKFITSFDIYETFFGSKTVSAKGGEELANKINELVLAINKLHEEAENNARIRANHEKQIHALDQKEEK